MPWFSIFCAFRLLVNCGALVLTIHPFVFGYVPLPSVHTPLCAFHWVRARPKQLLVIQHDSPWCSFMASLLFVSLIFCCRTVSKRTCFKSVSCSNHRVAFHLYLFFASSLLHCVHSLKLLPQFGTLKGA